MIDVFLIIGLIISLGLSFIMFILVKNLLNKIHTYEMYILNFRLNLINTLEKMRDIDKQGVFSTGINSETGLFEANDPTSQIFKDLLNLVEELNKITE